MDAVGIATSALSVSDKIRALNELGMPRAEIARLLGKRYQHVRNVLEADRTARMGIERTEGVAETDRRRLRSSRGLGSLAASPRLRGPREEAALCPEESCVLRLRRCTCSIAPASAVASARLGSSEKSLSPIIASFVSFFSSSII